MESRKHSPGHWLWFFLRAGVQHVKLHMQHYTILLHMCPAGVCSALLLACKVHLCAFDLFLPLASVAPSCYLAVLGQHSLVYACCVALSTLTHAVVFEAWQGWSCQHFQTRCAEKGLLLGISVLQPRAVDSHQMCRWFSERLLFWPQLLLLSSSLTS